MSEHRLLEEIRDELRGLKEAVTLMTTANDQALLDLQSAYSELSDNVGLLLTALQQAGSTGSDDISAGVEAVTGGLNTLAQDVATATGQVAPPAPTPAPAAPDAPSAPDAPTDTTDDAPIDEPAAPAAPPAPGG